MNSCQKYFSACLLAVSTQAAIAQNAPTLGTASNFAVLGGAGATCTSPIPPLPAITVTGNVGSLLTTPGSVTGFPNFTPGANPCSISGNIHVGDPVAVRAYNDFVGAYNQVAAMACPADAAHNLSGNLGGMTLAPGFYCISGVGLLSGLIPLTLNGGANDTWLFKAASSLTPIGGSVVMAGGAQACNVYWQTGTAVSLDATQFLGNILAGSAITFTGVGSSLTGRALAKIESVTMTGASITGCGAQPGPGPNPHPCSDRVMGGGEIKIGRNGKATFAVTAGIRNGEFQGELTYIDHSTGMKVKGTGVTAYVVVDAVIDVHGNVVEMQVLSGHPLLVQAATDALRRWKYQPTILNDEPVPVQLVVTIKFRLY